MARTRGEGSPGRETKTGDGRGGGDSEKTEMDREEGPQKGAW